ncbi:MAG TPA: 1,2-phenylacetyl-CoA epoxidase subunit PaaE [Chitinophagaceae bacterium]|nr:1,2-phenylacetyl-CoA epoxidase subunit PaaE [Chitinophagaceae bacterium]
MSIHFHPLQIKEVRAETPECVSVAFDIPEHLKKDFTYSQGQSLTMRTMFGKEEIRRTYSLCSSPLDNEWRVAIKKIDGGLFSTFVNEKLKKGDFLEVMFPVGKFYTPLDPSHKKRYTAFAAGSGITPVLSLIKTTLATEPLSSFTLVYGNRSRNSIIFFEELEGLKNKYIDRFNLIHVLSRERTDTPLNYGRIGHDKLGELGKLIDYRRTDEFFVCGPEEMIFGVRDFLVNAGVDKKKIHFELFTTPGQKNTAARAISAGRKKNTGPVSTITVKLDGRSFDFDLPLSDDTSILDAALKQGADLPFACKGGVCCTCKARLLEGQVTMDVHWGLEDEEVEQGYILACQSHPVTEKVIVDFDVK